MNTKVETTFTLDMTLCKKIEKLAQKEYKMWEKKAARKQKQCMNTIEGCERGIFGEVAAYKYLQECIKLNENLNENDLYIHQLGIQERQHGVANKRGMEHLGDLVIFNKDEDGRVRKNNVAYHFEVKTIANHHPYGQILPYHTDKYVKNDVDYVIFVVVERDGRWCDEGVECRIYLSEKPKEIKKWGMKNNWFGKSCYTHEDYI